MTDDPTYGFDTLQIHAGAQARVRRRFTRRLPMYSAMPIMQPRCLTCKKWGSSILA